jgi:hypothetical protein
VKSGNTLTLKLGLTFATTLVTQNIYLLDFGLSGQSSGWVQEGSWTPAASLGPPTIVSITPTSGTGLSEVFTLVASDPNGANDLSGALLLINSELSGAGACFVYYNPQSNQISLANDAGTAFLTPDLTPGLTGTVSNSQCALNAATSSATKSGNDGTIKVSLTFTPAFSGVKDVYGLAFGLSNQSSFWVQEGTWTP